MTSYLLQEDAVSRFTLEEASGFLILEDSSVTATTAFFGQPALGDAEFVGLPVAALFGVSSPRRN